MTKENKSNDPRFVPNRRGEKDTDKGERLNTKNQEEFHRILKKEGLPDA